MPKHLLAFTTVDINKRGIKNTIATLRGERTSIQIIYTRKGDAHVNITIMQEFRLDVIPNKPNNFCVCFFLNITNMRNNGQYIKQMKRNSFTSILIRYATWMLIVCSWINITWATMPLFSVIPSYRSWNFNLNHYRTAVMRSTKTIFFSAVGGGGGTKINK